jgi:protein tyrosine phosphatase (PTP) superfamily phosphohydrolase (DUF442 family)
MCPQVDDTMNEIRNYIQMTPTVGTSGQPTVQQFRDIAEAGYSTVINLAMPDSDDAVPDEGSLVTSLGMKYIHIPVPFDNPTKEHLRSFLRVMRALDGEKVWVHCVVNARVSAFMFQYLRMDKGFSDDAARNQLLRRWEPRMDVVWKRFMQLRKDELESDTVKQP